MDQTVHSYDTHYICSPAHPSFTLKRPSAASSSHTSLYRSPSTGRLHAIRRVSSATHSDDSYYYHSRRSETSSCNMRWFLSFGLFIPAIAAIIGVVTWSASAQMIRSSKDDTQMHLIPSSAAFRFSQGSRDHEWHGLLNNEPVDTSQSDSKEDYDLTLDSMTPDPVSTFSSSNTSETLNSLNFTSSSLPHVTATSNSAVTVTVNSTTSTVTSTRRSIFANSSTTSISSFTTTVSPMTSTPMKTLLMPANSTLPSQELVNNRTFINHTIVTAASPIVTSSTYTTLAPVNETKKSNPKNKKSPGEHVAAVIDKLISTRKYEGSKAKILVVAPASGTSRKSIDTMIANVYSTDVSSKKSKSIKQVPSKIFAAKSSHYYSGSTVTPTVTVTAATAIDKSVTPSSSPGLPFTPSAHLIHGANIKRTNRTQVILSKDADTLLAAAAILSAHHKIISSRTDDQQQTNHSIGGSINNHSTLSSDLNTTVKPPTTPFSRINHMQFPPPRAVSSIKVLGKQVHQLTQQHHRHGDVTTAAPVMVKLHHRAIEKQSAGHKVPNDNHIAMASHQMVTHVLPDRRVIVHQPHQPSLQVPAPSHHLAPSVAPVHLLQQVPVFASHQQLALENVIPYHIQQQQQQQQQPPLTQQHHHHLHLQQQQQQQQQVQLQHVPSNPERGFASAGFVSPVHQLNSPPLTASASSATGHIVSRPMSQIPLYQGTIYRPSTTAPFVGTHNINNNAPSVHNNNEPVDESQIISHSSHTLNTDESKNNAMLSLHAADQQSGESSKGLTLHFGGGPGAAGSQLITSPIGIFKSLFLPLLPKPRMRLNGKVVFGVVLDSQITPKKG